MKTITILPLLVVVLATHCAGQIFQARDSGCVNLSPIDNESIINGALSYSWNFGNGQTSTVAVPPLVYSVVGSYTLSLNVSVAATDRIMTELTVSAIPNTWNDGIGTDPLPDLYFRMIDQNGNVIFDSPAIFDKNPPVKFTNFILLKPNLNYLLEIWEYDIIGQDDLLGYMTVNTNQTSATLTNGGTTVSYLSETGKTTYSHSKTVKAIAKPTVTLSFANGLLTAQSSSANVTYNWLRNGVVIDGATASTYRPTTTGSYSVRVTASSDCIINSNVINVTSVATIDLDDSNPWKIIPNPVKANENMRIYVLSYKTQPVKMTIYDLLGRIVQQKTEFLQSGENNFEMIAPKECGFYFIEIYSEKELKTLKLRVE
ncbi:MAG: T9SS type A sorting domain-containing protein [Saprospiraceae bacterium]|nr:T9SS type A sorting domain-containing protein [Saprospiraceae bacterium]